MAQRDGHSRFLPGTSGNPGGEMKAPRTIRALAMQHSVEALDKLLEHMRSDDAELSLRAAMAVLDRALGKPAQAITGPDGGAIEVEHGLSPRAAEIAEEIRAALGGKPVADDAWPRDREAALGEQVAAARRQ